MEPNNIQFFRVTYQPFSYFSSDIGTKNKKITTKDILQIFTKNQLLILEQEVKNEENEVRYNKLPIDWCLVKNSLVPIGINKYIVDVKHHTMDRKIVEYTKYGEWEILS